MVFQSIVQLLIRLIQRYYNKHYNTCFYLCSERAAGPRAHTLQTQLENRRKPSKRPCRLVPATPRPAG